MYMYMYIYLGGGGFREPMDFTAFEKLGSIGSPWGNHVPFKRLKGTIPIAGWFLLGEMPSRNG